MTGFRIGSGRYQKLYIRDPENQINVKNSKDRDYITVVEAVSAVGPFLCHR